jgi:nucleoside-diphosphate-sugar epimerase
LKILLTGASGFVGSHVLDHLRSRGLDTAVLLRTAANQRFLQPHLSALDIRPGSLDDLASLRQALDGVTHVIHCAGATKAARLPDFYKVNQFGTRRLLEAVNAQPGIRRFIHISSLAAAGPAGSGQPAQETDRPHPVSEYGKSKLAGELEVRTCCRVEYVIVRPPVVYGPRDAEFLRMFKAAKAHFCPRPPAQSLSLVFVRDLAAVVGACLEAPAAAGKTYFAANPEVVTASQMAEEISRQMGAWTLPLPCPAAFLWFLCLTQEISTRLTRRPNVLSLQKFAELREPGWVCDAGQLKRDLGFECATTLKEGIAQTLAWYRDNQWL